MKNIEFMLLARTFSIPNQNISLMLQDGQVELFETDMDIVFSR